MMTKTLLTTALAAMLAFSVGACAQSTPASYKPHLSVLAKELQPSEQPINMFALQGEWAGKATLLQEITPAGVEAVCSQNLDISWSVQGSELTGQSVSVRHGTKSTLRGQVDTNGRFEVDFIPPNGHKERVSGWFRGNRAIAYGRGGNRNHYCDYRFDMTRRS